MSSGDGGDAGQVAPRQTRGGEEYVDARGVQGLLVGDLATQVNYFYQGTWTGGIAPDPLVGMSGEIDSPYRGLGAFGERDAALFFGREGAAGQVLGLMSRRLEESGLVVISGVSGAGKSSLLRAGVLPRLRGEGLGSAPEAASWPCLVFTPGRAPLRELAVRVAPVAGADAAAVLPGLASDPERFALTARQAAVARSAGVPEGAGQRRVLFVVDQLEQLFTQCQDEGERRAFITALHAAAADSGGQQGPAALVVLVVRADFEARLADYPLLAPAVQGRFLLTAMTELQLRMAITRPAAVAGSAVDEDLVRVLLQEARAHPGAAGDQGSPVVGAGVLPLLSHALDQAWRRRSGGTVTLADYERTGGITGAVADSAQRAYSRLAPAQQEAARQVFTRLTAVSDNGADTAVRVAHADLTAAGTAGRSRDVEAVLEVFSAERLLTLTGGSVEISHEVLLTAWPLLRDTWLAETRADRAVRARLQITAGEWDRADRDPSYLYSGSRLESASQVAVRIGGDARQVPLGQSEDDFLRASRHAAQRRRRLRQGFLSVLLALLAGLAVMSAAAFHADQATAGQRDIADYQRDVAISEELASDSRALGGTNATSSQLESIAAWGIHPSAQSYYAMLAAAVSPQTATLTGASGTVWSVAFSPDGKTLATSDGNHSARLWNTSTGQQIRTLQAGARGVWSVAFSPDGKTLATGDYDGSTRLWNTSTGQQIRTLRAGIDAVSSVSFSPDGKTLATGDYDGSTRLWNTSTGQQIRTLPAGAGGDLSVAFSPDSKTLVTSDGNGTVRLWNTPTGRQIRTLPAGAGGDSSLAFSPDGKILATGEVGGSARLWNTATGRQIGTLQTGAGEVSSVAFSPDSKTLATGDYDGTARLWNLGADQRIRALRTGANEVSSVAFSPDGKTLATGDDGSGNGNGNGKDDGSAWLWNIATGRQIRALRTGADEVSSVAFSPDGKTLATGDDDGSARLWNTATGRQIRAVQTGAGEVSSVAFSPDGKTLATGGDDGSGNGIGNGNGSAWLWNTATGQRIRALRTGADEVSSVAFSPDGKTLATGDDGSANGKDDGSARLWNTATGQQISTLRVGAGGVWSVAFSPDGKTLATGDDDGTARLWNTATGQQISTLQTGADEVLSVAFSPDGKTLATGDDDGAARLWNVDYLVDVLARLCAQVGGSLTRAEWARYVPSGPSYWNVCAQQSLHDHRKLNLSSATRPAP